MSGKKSAPSPSPEILAAWRAELEVNERLAAKADARGQGDTIYHTTVTRLRAALAAHDSTEVKHDGELEE